MLSSVIVIKLNKVTKSKITLNKRVLLVGYLLIVNNYEMIILSGAYSLSKAQWNSVITNSMGPENVFAITGVC